MTIQQMLLGAKSAGGVGVEFDLTQGSTPAGMTSSYGQSGPSLSWSSGVGVAMYGNAGSNSYPLRLTTAFSGDYLFQLSTRIDNSCSDAGVALFNSSYTSSGWNWSWSSSSGRIAIQNNCPQPYIYGQSGSIAGTSGVLEPSSIGGSGTWITMHFRHLSSQSKVKYSVTKAKEDWTESGVVLQSAIQLSEYFSGTYYVGISADFDSGTTYHNAFRYEQL